MRTIFKIHLFLILTLMLLIFQAEPVMAQSQRYVRGARPVVTQQRAIGNGSYVRRNQPAANPRTNSRSAESRARQDAEVRMRGSQNEKKIIMERVQQKVQRTMQNNNSNAYSSSSSSSSNSSSRNSSSSSSTRRCAFCKGSGYYECHVGYYDPEHTQKHHNCPNCGAYHNYENVHAHKCQKCNGHGYK